MTDAKLQALLPASEVVHNSEGMTFPEPARVSNMARAMEFGVRPEMITAHGFEEGGVFVFKIERGWLFTIMSTGIGWQHVSVSHRPGKKTPLGRRCPTWGEMCFIKDQFWEPEACVVQFHPPRSDYVNSHPFTLHLWRWTEGVFPRPDRIMV